MGIFILRAVTVADFIVSLFFVESKALKQAHSKLRNYFSNAAIGKNQPIENRNCGRTKYITIYLLGFMAASMIRVISACNSNEKGWYIHEKKIQLCLSAWPYGLPRNHALGTWIQ